MSLPQPITEDSLTLVSSTVVYFQVTVPQAAVYEITNYIVGSNGATTTPAQRCRRDDAGRTLTSVTRSTPSCAAFSMSDRPLGVRVARVDCAASIRRRRFRRRWKSQMKADGRSER